MLAGSCSCLATVLKPCALARKVSQLTSFCWSFYPPRCHISCASAPTARAAGHVQEIKERRRYWRAYSPEEDAALKAAVKEEIERSGPLHRRRGVWTRISNCVPGRSPHSVALRWATISRDPRLTELKTSETEIVHFRRPWTPEESKRLLDAVKKEAGDRDLLVAAREWWFWTRVAASIGGDRTNRSCRQRYMVQLKEGRRRGRFSKQEDKEILELNAKMPGDYAEIARAMSTNRSSSAIRDRLMYRLDPHISWTSFTEEEDDILRRHMTNDPGNWRAAARALPGRTTKQCMDRWFVLMPGKTSGAWTAEEDSQLCEIYNALLLERGQNNFSYGDVAQKMGTRNRKQCYTRHKVLLRSKVPN